jgi:hypothetical protein
MIELDTICMALWAVAPIYVAVRRATRRATAPLPHEALQRRILRPALMLLFLVVAIWLGTRQDLATAVVIAAITMLCAGGCHGA